MRAVTIEDMRNSLLPIILIILTTGGAWWLIRGGAERGAGGPDVAAGILRLPQKTSQQTSPADITGTTTITGDAPADSATWRVILISGDDRHPLTNSAVLPARGSNRLATVLPRNWMPAPSSARAVASARLRKGR